MALRLSGFHVFETVVADGEERRGPEGERGGRERQKQKYRSRPGEPDSCTPEGVGVTDELEYSYTECAQLSQTLHGLFVNLHHHVEGYFHLGSACS